MRQRGGRPTPVQRELRRAAEAIEKEWVWQGCPWRVWPDYTPGRYNPLENGCCYALCQLGLARWCDESVVQRFMPHSGYIAPEGTMWSERILWLYLLAEAGEEVAYR